MFQSSFPWDSVRHFTGPRLLKTRDNTGIAQLQVYFFRSLCSKRFRAVSEQRTRNDRESKSSRKMGRVKERGGWLSLQFSCGQNRS